MKSDKLSGKFVLRVSPELHEELKKVASERGISLNQACQERLGRKTSKDLPLVESLKIFTKNKLIAVYQMGSTVRGEQTDSSDIDFLAVIDSHQTINRDLYRLWDQFVESQNLDQKISVHFVHLPDLTLGISSLWLEVALEGFLIFDPEYVVHRFLILIRKKILEQKYHRTFSHGQPVWIKNLSENS